MFSKIKSKKGFTLTELIVVIVIIAILAGVMLPALTSYIDRANKSADEQKVAGINMLLTEAQVTEKDFNNALEFKDYLENEMDYEGNYSLKIKGSYMWYDTKAREVVIITEDDEPKLEKLATTEKAEFVTAGELRSPEGLMQYDDESEVWLIGGNGYLVELVEEIRNIGDNGAGELEEYKNLDAEKKAIFNSFFGTYVFSGTKGTFKVDENGSVTVATESDKAGKEVIETSTKANLAELFHKEVILANIDDINKELAAIPAPVLLEINNNNSMKISITEESGLSYAAGPIYTIIHLLVENGCELGYIIPTRYNSIDEYEEVLEKIVQGYNNKQSNIITDSLRAYIKEVLGLEDNQTIDIENLKDLYTVDLTKFSVTPDLSELQDVFITVVIALNLKENTENGETVYDFVAPADDYKTLFDDKDIRLIGIFDSGKYNGLNANYVFKFDVTY